MDTLEPSLAEREMHYDDAERAEIRRKLLDYMTAHGIKDKKLALEITDAHPRKKFVSYKTLGRFLTNERKEPKDDNGDSEKKERGTSTALLEAIQPFLRKLNTSDTLADFCRAVADAYKSENMPDTKLMYLERGEPIESHKEDNYWLISKIEFSAPRRLYDGVMVRAGGLFLMLLRDVRTMSARTVMLDGNFKGEMIYEQNKMIRHEEVRLKVP